MANFAHIFPKSIILFSFSEALLKQRQMYERQMQMLRNQLMSPSTPSQPYPFFDPFTKMTPSGVGGSSMHPKYQQWASER